MINWLKQIAFSPYRWMAVPLVLLFIFSHFSMGGASISIGLIYLAFFSYCIINRQFLLVEVPNRWVLAMFFFMLLLTGLLSIDPSESLRLFFQKRLPLWSLALLIPLAFSKRDDVKELFRIFLLIGGVTMMVGLVLFIVTFTEINSRMTLFTHYMTTGGMTMIVSLMALATLIHPKTPTKWRWFVAGVFLFSLASLLATSTRSSWLGFGLGVIILGILIRKETIYFLIAMVVAFYLFAPQNYLDRAASIVDPWHPNNVGRLNMWTTGFEIWKDYPVLGVGDHDLKKIYAEYKQPDDWEEGGHLHNTVVMWLVTTGVVGLLVTVTFLFYTMWNLFTIWRKETDWLGASVSSGTLAVFFGFLLNGLFEWNFGDAEIVTYLSLLLGLNWILFLTPTERTA